LDASLIFFSHFLVHGAHVFGFSGIYFSNPNFANTIASESGSEASVGWTKDERTANRRFATLTRNGLGKGLEK